MRLKMIGAACAALALSWPALADDAQWTELTNLPKGLNVAPGIRLTILGIEPGASLAEVRTIAEGLMGEHVPDPGTQTPDGALLDQYGGVDLRPPLREVPAGIMLRTPGGDSIRLEYTGRIEVDRDLPGNVSDNLVIELSAPSSGNQVLGAQRRIEYNDDAQQPRIAPMLEDLRSRFGANPTILANGPFTTYRWQFDNGVQVNRPQPDRYDCYPYIGEVSGEAEVAQINTRSGGDCDVVLEVTIKTGISDDHAKALTFVLSDNERGRANLTTDFGFFHDYATKYQDSAGGEGPKL